MILEVHEFKITRSETNYIPILLDFNLLAINNFAFFWDKIREKLKPTNTLWSWNSIQHVCLCRLYWVLPICKTHQVTKSLWKREITGCTVEPKKNWREILTKILLWYHNIFSTILEIKPLKYLMKLGFIINSNVTS